MGHIVNPVSHRLGNSKCWNSVWSNDSNFSFRYSSLMKSDWDISLFFKRFFDLKILVQSGYIFSHVKIIRECQKIFCIVYFYDGGSLERSDNMRHILLSRVCQLFGIENLFLISLYAFLRLYHWNSYYVKLFQHFKFQLLFHYFNHKRRFYLLRSFFRRQVFMALMRDFVFIIDSLVILDIKQSACISVMLNSYFRLLLSEYVINKVNFQLLLTGFSNIVFVLLQKRRDFSLGICKQVFLNLYFSISRLKFVFNKIQVFFLKKILNLFIFLRWRMFARSSLMSKLLRYGFNFFSFNRYFLYYFGDVFSSYFRLKARFLHSLKHTFQKLFVQKASFSTKVILKKLDVTDLNAAVMAKYITIRLRQRFQLKEALLPMLRHLSYNNYVRGFRVVCAGRFTRKEIALYDLRTYSSVPFSGVSAKLDFALAEVVLKYSICGVKVWLHRVTLPEREYIIDAIGLQFILPPPIQEMFQENLELLEEIREVPFRFETLNEVIFTEAKTVMNDLDFKNPRKQFVTFATRMSISVDFFFLTHRKSIVEGDEILSSFKDKFLL